MDRFDERKDDHRDNPTDREEARTGDVLGLGGAAVPKAPGDPSAAHDPESRARRRERSLDDDTTVSGTDDLNRGAGATGIDMGSGGTGTDTSGR